MSRALRLLTLLELLRAHRAPVRGAVLATRLGVSLRTLYRDIATLQAQGTPIAGAPGVGYLLRPGHTLPPLLFTEEELDALLLGARWVADRADPTLGRATRSAVAKIAAVLPPARRALLDDATLLVGPPASTRRAGPGRDARRAPRSIDPPRTDPGASRPAPAAAGGPAGGADTTAILRRAIRAERKVRLTYEDRDGRASTRTVWPVALGFFDRVQVLVTWCESRGAYRHFRPDRITALTETTEPYPHRRRDLLAAWRREQGIGPQAGDPLLRDG